MKCAKCGEDVGSKKFCPKCGTKVGSAQGAGCPGCGYGKVGSAKFCSECGYQMRGSTAGGLSMLDQTQGGGEIDLSAIDHTVMGSNTKAAGIELASDIEHYRIEEEIGRGGMGVVYRAIDTRLERAVALKRSTQSGQ